MFFSAFVRKSLGVSFSGKSSNLKEGLQKLYSKKGLSADNILTPEGIPVFDLNVPEDTFFLLEMNVLSNLLETLKSSDVGSLLGDSSPDFITFASSSLKGLSEKYGETSDQYKTGVSIFYSTMKKVQSQFNTMFEQQGAFELLFVNGKEETVPLFRERRSIVKRDYLNIAAPCYDTPETCMNATNSCSNATQSTCVYVKRVNNDDCWRCKCSANFAGDSCEFTSLIAPFHTIFWISLTLVVSLVVICYALAYMDPGKDTLLHKTASKAKTE